MYSFESSREQLLSMGRILAPRLVKVELHSGPLHLVSLGDGRSIRVMPIEQLRSDLGRGESAEKTRRRRRRILAADIWGFAKAAFLNEDVEVN